MGYYTRYMINSPSIEEWTDEVKKSLSEIQPSYFPKLSDVDDLLDYMMDDSKWYDHEEDMTKLSIRHPTLLFELYGKGEDGEQWKKYFKNGKSFTTYATVTFEEFNEKKLK